MPLAARRQLARMAAKHDIAVIEDVIYDDLAEQDDKRNAVKGFDESGHVLICGSFSKTIAPGLRLGWVELPESLDSMRLFDACLAERIGVTPGKLFSAGERYGNCIRLSLGGSWTPQAQRALARVGEIASTMLEA